jgi:hypothetical protein
MTRGIASSLSLQTNPCEKVVDIGLKRSKSEGNKSKRRMESESEEEDDESDEGIRCRTPLLSRNVGAKQDAPSSVPSLSNTRARNNNAADGRHKKVSFKARSLDGSGPTRILEASIPDSSTKKIKKINSAGRQNLSAEGGEQEAGASHDTKEDEDIENVFLSPSESSDGQLGKRFALVPAEESLVGWNQSGGPFTSQWLFQAVNPGVEALLNDISKGSPVIYAICIWYFICVHQLLTPTVLGEALFEVDSTIEHDS